MMFDIEDGVRRTREADGRVPASSEPGRSEANSAHRPSHRTGRVCEQHPAARSAGSASVDRAGGATEETMRVA